MLDCPISVAAAALASQLGGASPRVAIILGSGLGGFAGQLEQAHAIPFRQIPHLAHSTAHGHRGEFVAGRFGRGKTPVVAMSGRLHCYEGWSLEQVTFPVAVLAELGVEVLIVSNAAGGLHPNFCVGDIMVLRDHINWISLAAQRAQRRAARPQAHLQRPANGTPSDGTPRGPAQTTELPLTSGRGRLSSGDTYDPELAATAMAAARRADFAAYEGTYLATLGPTYETRAEYRMMRRVGADAVGMSTIPEVLEARRRGLRVLALSMISNLAFPKSHQQTDHQQVLAAGQRAEPKLRQIVDAALSTLI